MYSIWKKQKISRQGKDFDYKNVTDYKDITVKQVPMLIHVENKKIDHVYYKASDIKKALEQQVKIMLKFALEMLWTERKKAYGLIASIVTTLSICLLFLHFIINPYLAKKVTYDDILDFSEPYCIMLMGLFILMVCVSLICYSCNYYMKLSQRNRKLKMAGFNQGKVVLYQLFK